MGAYEKAMEVVQNDTVNVNTPGYVKQSVVFESLPFDLVGAQAGGVEAGQVLNSRDEYAEHNVQIQQTAAGTIVGTGLSPGGAAGRHSTCKARPALREA